MADLLAASQAASGSEYEAERAARIAENKKRMQASHAFKTDYIK